MYAIQRRITRRMQTILDAVVSAVAESQLRALERPSYKKLHSREVTNRRWIAMMAERDRRAATTTYDFIDEHLRDATYCLVARSAWKSLSVEVPEGAVLQFGVYTGSSINALARIFPTRKIHGFDSFEGLPSDWSYVPKGTFDLKGELPSVHDNVILYKGWFDDTLPQWLENNDEKIAFLDVDCDIYESASCVLRLLRDRIQVGTIIHFDELIGYYGWQEHEYKALQEFLAETGYSVEYTHYGLTHVCCRVVSKTEDE